jgi:hypothetical protein
MNKKHKLPTFDHSLFTVDASLNDKINILSSNADFQENHKKLRSLIRNSNQKELV